MASQNDNTILNLMYRGTTTIQNFCWDNMTTVPIYSLMTPEDVESIRDLIMSPRYSGNNKFKMERIDAVMHFRGFTRFAGGTNRLVYTHPAAPNAVFKVAIDSIGINDNPAEFRNQHFLKPYCCKVFECSACGTIASFEKVERITTFEEFYSIADDYFYILSRVILGKYVMEDIGTNYFMNIGIRKGCHPVILDFPYLFELDGRKLECSSVLDDGSVCHGEIDYDHGFNKLICSKCGREYRARDLAKPPEGGGILLKRQGGCRMTIEYVKGGKVVKTVDTTIERDHLSKEDKAVRKNTGLQVSFVKNGAEVGPVAADTKAAKVVKKPAPSKATGLVVEYVGGTKKPDSKASEKPACAPVEKPMTKGFAVVEETPKTPVLEHVIAVSFGKTTTKASDKIVKESSNSGLKVVLPSDEKKEEKKVEEVKPVEEKKPEKVEAPVVKETVPETPKAEPKEEVKKEAAPEKKPAPKKEEAKVETPAKKPDTKKTAPQKEEKPKKVEAKPVEEKKPEKVEAPAKPAKAASTKKPEKAKEEAKPVAAPVDEAPVEEKKMVEAITFDDPTPEKKVEEPSESEDKIIATPFRMFFGDKLPELKELEPEVFYCVRTCEQTREDALLEAEYVDPKDIDENKYDIFMLINGEVARMVYDFENDVWGIADDEDQDVFDVVCVDVLPTNDDVEDDVIYCIPNDASVEHFVTFTTSDLKSIDSKNYSLFLLLYGTLRRVTIGEDGGLYEYTPSDEEEDEDLEAFKNSSKKKSLD